MANAVSSVDFEQTLAESLAVAVSDGTYADVVSSKKTDEPGQEAAATQIAQYFGALWADRSDDFRMKAWAAMMNTAGAGVIDVQTTDATPSVNVIQSFAADGDARDVLIRVQAKHQSSLPGVAYFELGGVYQRTATGVYSTIAPIATSANAGLAVSAALAFNVDALELTLTGLAANNIRWFAYVVRNVALRSYT